MSAYHVLPRPLSYGDYVGLILNLDRVRYQRAEEQRLGLRAATGNDPLEYEWADAVARFEAQVEHIHYERNADRAEARTMEQVYGVRR